ncbi:hypothetical protein [Nostocoides sp. F2B08]|uniref:hypothetical protein n=1 Tax=Nostocoides sp. F2B08 TaxID=2653936 RepID=UPI001D036E6D|nr:hypothetical protein [Tetrasphaera sp. F2B08]
MLNTIQTNATLLSDEWAAFLKEYDFLIGVSVDGPRAMHDAFGSTRAASRRSTGRCEGWTPCAGTGSTGTP